MNQSDYKKFAILLAGVAELYGSKLTSGIIKIYWEALHEHDYDVVAGALSYHVKNPDAGAFMPKPADIIRAIAGTGETRAMEAWSKLLAAIRRHGRINSVVFDDPIIHAVVRDMGGWTGLCMMTTIETPFKAKEFYTRYQGYLPRPGFEYPKKLIGESEFYNAQGVFGHRAVPPILVGDKKRAIEVFGGGNEGKSDDAMPAKLPLAHLKEIDPSGLD